jgi:hypothetical protein
LRIFRRDNSGLTQEKGTRLQHHVTNGSRLSFSMNRFIGKNTGFLSGDE